MSTNKNGFFSTVISGSLRSRKIYLPDKEVTRSTKSIIRGSIFNSIGISIYGTTFVEVFGGSGSMGIEAISRGAKEAIFIEKDRSSFECLKKNITTLDIQNAKLFNTDSFEYFDKLLDGLSQNGSKVFFYFDPPFDTREGMGDIYEKTCTLIEKIPAGMAKKILIEHISSYMAPEQISKFNKTKTRKFGKTTISEYENL
jgi:16S rRNA (guanine966-N2)-methyltransferase